MSGPEQPTPDEAGAAGVDGSALFIAKNLKNGERESIAFATRWSIEIAVFVYEKKSTDGAAAADVLKKQYDLVP